jgi:hypothetical protein
LKRFEKKRKRSLKKIIKKNLKILLSNPSPSPSFISAQHGPKLLTGPLPPFLPSHR